jgi:hypothetical protein
MKAVKKKKKPSLVFRADVVTGMPQDVWPIVRPFASARVLKWLNKHRGTVVRCSYEVISKAKP